MAKNTLREKKQTRLREEIMFLMAIHTNWGVAADQILSLVKKEIISKAPKEDLREDEQFEAAEYDPAIAYEMGRKDEGNQVIRDYTKVIEEL